MMRALILLCALLPACSMTMDLPSDFLRLERSGAEFKAITPDDGRLWVREFADPSAGTLEFWATTLRNDFVENRGYELVGDRPVRDGTGRAGQEFEFRTFAAGEGHGYLLTVFVLPAAFWPWSEQQVLVAEFGAREPVFVERLEAVRTALGTLQP
jgi:hypothetical protein